MQMAEIKREVKKDTRAIHHLEARLLVHSRRYNIYEVFEDTPEYYSWLVKEVLEFDSLRKSTIYKEKAWWEMVEDLAYSFGRSHEEVVMLIFDRELGNRMATRENKEAEYLVFDKTPEFCYWHLEDVLKFDAAYKRKTTTEALARMFDRSPEEVALLILDRALKDKI